MTSKAGKKQIQRFRNERIRTHGVVDKKEDLPLFKDLNAELTKAKTEAVEQFLKSYPQYKQLFKLRIGAKNALEQGDMDAYKDFRKYEKENFKWNRWTEFLEYANPPKK